MPRPKLSPIESFARKYLVHTKGDRFAGKPFTLLPWQQKVLRALFETFNSEGRRRYRQAYIEVPKKNGKTELSALIALYMLLKDPEPGAEIYSCAVDRAQASLCFKAAKAMVEANDVLRKVVKVRKYELEYKNNVFSPRSAEAKGAHGINPSCLIIDELHAWSGGHGRDYFDALTAGTVNRSEPLIFMITTAGDDQTSVCWERHEYARQVREGIIKDDTFYSFVSAAPQDADWTDPQVWEAANPSYGVTITEEAMSEKANEAMNSPAKQNAFRRLHLNQWVQQAERWLDLRLWDKNTIDIVPDTLKGRSCYMGLDLSSRQDLSCLVLLFPATEDDDHWYCIPYFWVPGFDLTDKSHRDQVPYTDWVRDKHLISAEGDTIDYAAIRDKILELSELFNVEAIAYDPWNAAQFVQELQDEYGFQMVQIRQGYKSLSQPSKELLSLLTEGTLKHNGNPVMRWNMDNVCMTSDTNANIKPDKKKSRQKIDGAVALIMAIAVALVNQSPDTPEFTAEDLIAVG